MFLNQKDSKRADEELLNEFRAYGDLKILGTLFSRYSGLVYGVCLKYLKDRDESKDAVMQIFEVLPTNIKKYEVQHFKSWLYTSSKNHCLMKIRASKARFQENISDTVVENELVMHQVDDDNNSEEDLTKLEKCIERLKENQKECVQLFFLEERCYKEIAEKTGMDLKMVKSQIQNGKRNLKLCMEQSE